MSFNHLFSYNLIDKLISTFILKYLTYITLKQFKVIHYFQNNDYMIIISYAEGDFNVSLYTDKKEYNNAVIKTHNFYETEKFYEKNGNVWTNLKQFKVIHYFHPLSNISITHFT